MKRYFLSIVFSMLFTVCAWSEDELVVYQGLSNGQIYYSVINKNTNYGYMDLYFSILDEENKTCELTKAWFWEEKYDNKLTIPHNVYGYSVKGIGKGAFNDLGNGNENLTIVLPNTIEYIANEAFSRFGRPFDVTLPDGLKRIGSHAFAYSGIRSIIMPNSVETIGSHAFEYCVNLASVIMSDNITDIPDWAFGDCSNLKTVQLPDNLVSIGEYAFSGCDLNEIAFPETLISIGFWAFSSNSITSLIIPKNVKELSANSLVCSKIKSIVVDEQNPYFDSRENCNAIIDSKSNRLVKGCINTVIPNTIISIGEEAFANCYDMVELPVIPESVVEVGRNAFMGTQWDMNLPSGLVYVGKVAYYYNDDKELLTSLELREGTKGIAEGTFEMCSNLASVTLPEGLIHIGDWAFGECSSLTEINFPSTVQHAEASAFYGTPWNDNLGEGLTYIGKVAYKYNIGGQTNIDLTFKEGTISISGGAFSGINVPIIITLPSSLMEIGGNAFGYCPNIQSIYSYIEKPFDIDRSTFLYYGDDKKYHFTSANLYVPIGTRSTYENAEGWKLFQNIVEMEPENKEKCATPTITYIHGKLHFDCATPGARFMSKVTAADAMESEKQDVQLSAQYIVSVKAVAKGYADSDEVTATVTWGDGTMVVENITVEDTRDMKGDVNNDGTVDVADIASVISIMAANARRLNIED